MRLLSIVFLFATASAAHANQATVRSGEQIGFTRIIVEFQELPEWKSERVGRSQKIELAGATTTFDLSRAFRLINRDRVSDIRVTAEGLELDIACDCDVTVSQVAPSALAADVKPRESSAGPVAMDSLTSMTSPAIDNLAPALSTISNTATDETIRETPAKIVEPLQENAFDMSQPLPVKREPISLGPLELLLQDLEGGQAVTLIGEQLSRAAAQGLVDIQEDIGPRQNQPNLGLAQLPDRSNLSIATGIDRTINPELDRIPPTQNGTICIHNSQVDVNSWGDVSDFNLLGKYRAAAIAENGGIDPRGAKALARLYLAMGFGAEAQVVAAFLDVKDRKIIMALADIMDRGRTDETVLEGQIFCKGKVALWAMLAKPVTAEDQPTATQDILATFSALPPHLRTHLGPTLSERLRQLGLNEQSRNVINAMTRGGKVSNESDLATARLDLDGKNAKTARQTLSELSLGTDTTAAEALLELLLDAERRGMSPNPDWVTEDAPSLVRAVEGTDIAADLNLAGLRGRIALEMYDSFRSKLAEETPGLDNESRPLLARLALEKAVETVSDTEFVKAEIGLSRLIEPRKLETNLRLALAERLRIVGIPKRSKRYLLETPSDPREVEVAARVELAIGNVSDAIAMLEAFDGEGLATLLGQAYVLAGNSEAAILTFDSAQQDEEALTTAFRFASWEWISENEIDQISDAVHSLRSTEEITASENPNGLLISKSRDLRSQVEYLLGSTQPKTFETPFTN